MKARPVSRIAKQLSISLLLALSLGAAALADEITLNLKDADIRALISTVSKFTGKNFIIDPRVKAKITVISSETLTPDEVYEVFPFDPPGARLRRGADGQRDQDRTGGQCQAGPVADGGEN